MTIDWPEILADVLWIAGPLVGAGVLLVVVHLAVRYVGRRTPWLNELATRVRKSWMTFVIVLAVALGLNFGPFAGSFWWPYFSRWVAVAVIIAGAWLLAELVSFGFESLIAHESATVGAYGRRRRTQLVVLHRLVLVIIGVVAGASALFMFPSMRVIGTSLLASAGLVSIVAGLAAQSVLGNLIAGVQLAFTDLVRVGDVVVVEGEWGRIGEVNLSYVVVHIWDERRLVLPCTYFTTKPIETWTRSSDKVIGIVLLDLDWTIPIDDIRAKFDEILNGTALWDRRSSGVVVLDAQGGFVTVRFTMSAKDSSDQFDLRCLVREEMVKWLQAEHPASLPTTRVLMTANAQQSLDSESEQS